MENKSFSILAVADSPGHILERLCVHWANYGSGVHHTVQSSRGVSNYELCQMAKQYDAIHWVDQLRFIYCASAISVPQVVMVHHLTPDMEEKLMTKVKYCDALTTASMYWYDYLTSLVRIPVYLLPYTIDTNCFVTQPHEIRNQLRQKAGIQNGEFVIGFVGKAKADHMGRKGLDLFLGVLQAASELWPNLVVVLVGPGWEVLKTTIESLGIRVLHYEFDKSEDTRNAYWLMDVLLVTAKVEGGPVTVLEAMGCGVPVITSQVGHVSEVIRDGTNGFICPQRKSQEYIVAMERLRDDKETKADIIKNARAFVIKKRENSLTVPQFDFVSIYTKAHKHYSERTSAEKFQRYLGQRKLWLRYKGRRILEHIGSQFKK